MGDFDIGSSYWQNNNTQISQSDVKRSVGSMGSGKKPQSVFQAKPAQKTQAKPAVQSSDNGTSTQQSKQKRVSVAKDNYSNMAKEYNKAHKLFDSQMKKDGVFEDIADGVSKIWNNPLGESLGISTGNTADQVREDFSKLKSGLDEMRSALQKGDMNCFESAFKKTYGVEYNEQNMNEYYKNPTEKNRKKAFGDSRVSNILARVSDYNDSQETGGSVAKGVAIGAAAAATGGAGAALAAGAAASVVCDGLDILTAQDSRARYDAGGGAEGIVTRAVVSGAASGAGKAAGNYVAGKMAQGVAKTLSTEAADNMTNSAVSLAGDLAQGNVGNVTGSLTANEAGSLAKAGTKATVKATSKAGSKVAGNIVGHLLK